MIRRTHTACGADRYLTAFGLNPRQVIYFDIETTGFRASSSSLYMIGWAVLSDMSGEEWTLTQLLAQSHSEEVLLLELFQELAKEGPTFAFGFTYMIWQYLYEALREKGASIDLPGCHLIHGGGWKKLQNRSVSDETFRAGLKEVCGIDSVSDYYGMAEQTGGIIIAFAV